MNAENMKNGISAVMVNSPKGKSMLEAVKSRSRMVLFRRSYDELLSGNVALLQSPEYTSGRETFFENAEKKGFKKSVDDLQINNIQINSSKNNVRTKQKRFFLQLAAVLKRMSRKIKFYSNISLTKYIKYNYFSKNIIRSRNSYIIPYKGTVLDIDNTAVIRINAGNLYLGSNRPNGSKAETIIRLFSDGMWIINNGANISYGNYIEVCANALLETGYFSCNSNSVIVCAKRITLGEDVMIARNVIIYDSDHHQIYSRDMKMKNSPKDVRAGNHVWIATNAVILKGSIIGDNSIIGAATVVQGIIPDDSIVIGSQSENTIKRCNGWSREDTNYQNEVKQ